MKLLLQRKTEINNAVLGELFINDKFFCYTLEDKIRDVKIKHQTCISPGEYKIALTMSQRFRIILPLLLDVPNFTGIRIHAGNYADNERYLKDVSVKSNILTSEKIRIEVI